MPLVECAMSAIAICHGHSCQAMKEPESVTPLQMSYCKKINASFIKLPAFIIENISSPKYNRYSARIYRKFFSGQTFLNHGYMRCVEK